MEISTSLHAISRTDLSADARLEALRVLKTAADRGEIAPDKPGDFVNNHIHTSYSFSPYTPASAVFYAWRAGLKTAGIMDHDSVGGAREFLAAGEIFQLPVTVGFECRVSVAGTPMEGRRLNNPDQISCAYVAMHGIPHQSLNEAERILAPLRARRNERNRVMCARITELIAASGLSLDFERDVLPLSMAHEGGSVTERHVLFALTRRLTAANPAREDCLGAIERVIDRPLTAKERAKLLDAPEAYYEYDILGILKSDMVARFYVPAEAECMHVSEFTALAERLGAVSAYAYLGDVGESVTGDKKAQKFEDGFLDELFEELHRQHFRAVTYMPSRNTMAQLTRVMSLCERYDLFQISGEDINSPRQSFLCPALAREEFRHLHAAAFALIGHERAASARLEDGMFSGAVLARMPSLSARIAHYAAIGAAD